MWGGTGGQGSVDAALGSAVSQLTGAGFSSCAQGGSPPSLPAGKGCPGRILWFPL